MSAITLVLHNIRSTYNVGAIFRSAEGFGVHEIICCGYTPYPIVSDDSRLPHIREKLTAQIHKSALGAEHMVPFRHFDTLEAWLKHNQSSTHLPLVALEQAPNSQNLRDFTPPETFALILGEEVYGIENNYLEVCDFILEIPMRGQKESFNVSVAAGIALYGLSN